MDKIILHIDMNSYFASVEQQANPGLRGRPVGVCEHLGGIIIAPSVEAKRLGIKLGTTTWDALKICPEIVLLPTDPEKYRSVTEKFMKILRDYSEAVEQYSIDEAFADLTEYCAGNYQTAQIVALEIKQRLRLEIGEWISCSIGIGPNKLIAKIAADLGEGDIDRIFLVRPERTEELYNRLSLTDVPGIGPRLARSLGVLGIFSLRALADYPLENLLNQFGISGYFLKRMARFEGGEEVEAQPELPKSIGHMYTVAKPIEKLPAIKKLMYRLAEKVGRRMRRHGSRGNVVSYFHSDKHYFSFHRERRIRELISDGRDIYYHAFRIFEGAPRPLRSIKIMGITIRGLNFDDPPEPLLEVFKKPGRVVRAMDEINDFYGDGTIYRARLLGIDEEWGKDTVGFGRMRK